MLLQTLPGRFTRSRGTGTLTAVLPPICGKACDMTLRDCVGKGIWCDDSGVRRSRDQVRRVSAEEEGRRGWRRGRVSEFLSGGVRGWPHLFRPGWRRTVRPVRPGHRQAADTPCEECGPEETLRTRGPVWVPASYHYPTKTPCARNGSSAQKMSNSSWVSESSTRTTPGEPGPLAVINSAAPSPLMSWAVTRAPARSACS